MASARDMDIGASTRTDGSTPGDGAEVLGVEAASGTRYIEEWKQIIRRRKPERYGSGEEGEPETCGGALRPSPHCIA